MKINIRELMSTGQDAHTAFVIAFDLCRKLQVFVPGVGVLQSSGTVHVPAGLYSLADSLVIPHHVHLEGEGQTSVLAFSNGGLELPRSPDSTFYSSNVIRDLCLINSEPDNDHAALDIMGQAGVQIERVWSAGWRCHYLIDQGELVSIDHCSIGGIDFGGRGVPPDATVGILYKDPPRPPATIGGATNCNWVSRCQFSIAGSPIVFEGGEQLTIDRCNFFDCGPIRLGGNRASLLYCIVERNRGLESIIVSAPGTVGAVNLEVHGCSFASKTSAIRFNTTSVYGFSFTANLCHTSHVRNAEKEILEERHVIENLPQQLVGPLIIVGNSNWGDAPMVAEECVGNEVALYASSAYEAGVGHRNRVGVGTIKPQALLDIRGGVETPDNTPSYGLQVRAGDDPVRHLRMIVPAVLPDW